MKELTAAAAVVMTAEAVGVALVVATAKTSVPDLWKKIVV